MAGGERIAENLEVQSAKHAFIFGDFFEVRIDTPLADFMAYNGDIVLCNEVAVVHRSLRRLGIKAAAQAGAPLVAPRPGRTVILVLRNDGPAGSACVKPARVLCLPVINQVSEKSFLIAPARFVAVCEHAERWMVAVCF